MKIKLYIFVAIIILTLVSVFFILKPDYKGIITELSENKFYLAPLIIDPEEEYDFPLIYFDEHTSVKGENVKSINDLKNNQKIKIWTQKKDTKIVAKKIKVID
jgi:hypothetical protein